MAVGSLRHVEQSHVGPHRLTRLAHLNEHVAVDLGDLAARDAGAEVEPVAVLGHDVGDLALLVQHEQRHVRRGGLGQTQGAGRHLLSLYTDRNKNHTILIKAPGHLVQKCPHPVGTSVVGNVGRGGDAGTRVHHQPLRGGELIIIQRQVFQFDIDK